MLLLHHPSSFLIPFSSPSQTQKRFLLRRTTTISASSSGDTRTLPQSAIQRISEKLRSLGYVEDDRKNVNTTHTNGSSPGQIFVPLPTHLPKYRVGHTLDQSWSTPENPVPQPGLGNAIQRFHELKGEVEKEKEKKKGEKKGRESARAPTLAELKLPAAELRRLRNLGMKLEQKIKVKVGKSGITEGIVNGIHERWRRTELVRIKIDDICRLNMKRTHDLLEKKTGGLVIWRSGSNIILYRGADYKYPYFLSSSNKTMGESMNDLQNSHGNLEESKGKVSVDISNSVDPNSSDRLSPPPLVQGVGSPDRVRFQMPGEAQLAEEADRLLEGLGPRFNDWWGYDPLPVDGDLLPAVVPGYRRPFRLLPYGVSPKLTNDEMTTLKRLGRPLPCHFVLGRNRKHQGLAASIIKLWEKCEIAKVAVKRGVQNTNSELMAEELKRLTGGILLSRDREFIVLYRGKDFLPAAVSSAIDEQRKRRMDNEKNDTDYSSSVTAAEEYQNLTENENCVEDKQRLTNTAIRRTSSKLSMTLAKKARAEKLLSDLEKEEVLQQSDVDKEGITEEERYMLRKIGLRMDPFLLLGRRGVFDGTIENMHLHWKYRELVKIITGLKHTEEIHGIARILEKESGGILVAVERVSKGYAIIIYRGKNYERPASLRPQTLLSKREALKRSLEAQRRQSLKLHVLKLTQRIDDLKLQLAKTKDSEDIQLAKEVKLGLVEEQEIENVQSTEYEMSDAIALVDSQSYPCEQQAQDSQVTDSTSLSSEDQIGASLTSLDIGQHDLPSDISMQQRKDDEVDEFDNTKQERSPKLVPKRFIVSSHMQVEDSQGETNSSATGDDVEEKTSHVVPSDSESEISLPRTTENNSEKARRALHLSNKERLILRKQALKMKKRPVLAVGKSNTVIGIAKTLKTHFEKHPLAIVNVKGRATGTSVREVVFKLEQATGAVLVSQEPSKIILYRGWGAEEEEEEEEEPAETVSRVRRNGSAGVRRTAAQPVVSAELISAIRIECGLLSNIEKEFAF